MVKDLYQSGTIDSLSASVDVPSRYTGTPLHADGMEEEVPPMTVPMSKYAMESFRSSFETIGVGVKLIATNDFRTSPDFYYLDNIPVTFLEGYDESFLAEPLDDSGIMKALISRDLQERIGAVLGDVVRMSIYTTDEGRRTASFGDELDYYDLRIVGSYEQQGQMETMYIPFDALLDLFDIWDAEMAGEDVGLTQEEIDQLSRGSFNSATFKLTDTKNLGQLKDFLSEYGYSQVNKIGKLRTFIVIDDAIFNNAVAGLQQQVRYVNTLYPFLYVLVGVIAFVVSYLLVVSRRMELATLRGLGASSLTTFMSFFLEQSLLCLIGVGLGMAAWRVLRGPFIPLHLWLILGFVGCYFVGSALSIGIMNRRNLLAILTDKD
jgi:hypothetical protein